MDITAISAAFSSIEIASKFLKGHIEQIKDSAVREKLEELLNAIIPLQSEIMSLQSSNFSHIKKIDELEKKLRETDNWRIESEDYDLQELAPGVRAYFKKSESNAPTKAVPFCPNCFDIHHKKSILQVSRESIVGKYYSCLNCKNELHTPSTLPTTGRIVHSRGFY